MEQGLKEVRLDQIGRNPWNPRTRFKGDDFEDLVESVRKRGVLSPILIRPLEDPRLENHEGFPTCNRMIDYELVFGERRFRAQCVVAGENGGIEGATIPAVVREMSDDDAFDAMTIENLQREDLSPLEEARNFQLYLERYGQDRIPELAERIGINHIYIRRRIQLLSLPEKALRAWDQGRLKYGHLEQFMRLGDDKKRILELMKDVIDYNQSVRRLKDHLDSESIKLKETLFDLEKEGCISCVKNSEVQKKLFGTAAEKGAHCMNPACYKQKMNNWLQANWKKTRYRKAYHTNGFRFGMDISWNEYESFYGGKRPAKCKDCERFVTLINLDGEVSCRKVCIGDKSCYHQQTREGSGDGSGKTSNGERSAPAWHGQFFRETFFKEQIPMRLRDVPADDDRALQLALISLVKSNRECLHGWFGIKHRIGDFADMAEESPEDLRWSYLHDEDLIPAVTSMSREAILEDLKEASERVVTEGLVPDGRRMVAEHLGIDLAKEWRLNEEYLKKKTIKEMLKLGEDLEVFSDKKAQTFLYETLLKKRGSFKSCKKNELIRVFLESGVELAGKVPAEILEKEE